MRKKVKAERHEEIRIAWRRFVPDLGCKDVLPGPCTWLARITSRVRDKYKHDSVARCPALLTWREIPLRSGTAFLVGRRHTYPNKYTWSTGFRGWSKMRADREPGSRGSTRRGSVHAPKAGDCVTCGHFPETRKDGDVQVMAREEKVNTINALHNCLNSDASRTPQRVQPFMGLLRMSKPNGEGPDQTKGGCERNQIRLRVG